MSGERFKWIGREKKVIYLQSSPFCQIDTLSNYTLGHESKTIWNKNFKLCKSVDSK